MELKEFGFGVKGVKGVKDNSYAVDFNSETNSYGVKGVKDNSYAVDFNSEARAFYGEAFVFNSFNSSNLKMIITKKKRNRWILKEKLSAGR